MERVQCVSLPRSGHNLLVSHLQKYFDSAAICEKVTRRFSLFSRLSQPSGEANTSDCGPANSSSSSDRTFHYCEYYYACRQHPCTEPKNSFQKSHDFELELPVQPDQKYLIQKRQPLDLLISWFEMRLLKDREEDTPDGFRAFVQRMRPYVDGFEQKWVDSDLQRRLVLDYEDYLNEPAKQLASVIRFFDNELDLNLVRIEQIVKDVRPGKDNSRFRFVSAVAAA